MRRRIGMAAAALASVTGVVLLSVGTASSAGSERSQQASAERQAASANAQANAHAAVPGNNGTVKIHDGADEPSPEVRNQPHVCTFHIHAFGFDAGQVLSFQVLSWQPTGDRSTAMPVGKITADATGEGRAPSTGEYSLPDGHYRLVVDTGNGTPTQDKHKMFWVQCTPTTSGGGDNPGGDNGGDTPGTPETPGTPDTPDTPEAPGVVQNAAPNPPVAQPSSGALPMTGIAALGPITVAGAAMLLLGLVLTLLSRRRSAGVPAAVRAARRTG